MEKKKKTIGGEADKIANKYFKLYLQLREDKNINIKERAKNLALCDVISRKLIYEFALERLTKKIEAEELKNPLKFSEVLN